MTLTQLGAFVLVARLGSVTAAAGVLGVSEPAVSQALTALRRSLGDELLVRGAAGMTLTPGGARLLAIASQIVSLGAEAQAAIRAAQGAPAQLRVVAESTLAEYVAPSLLDAFARRGGVESSLGVASAAEMAVLVHEHLADVALAPAGVALAGVVSQPVMRCRLIAVAAARWRRGPGAPAWLVDPSYADPASPVAVLLRRLAVPEAAVRVFPSHAAALAAAGEGAGIAPAVEHLVAGELDRGGLVRLALAGTPVAFEWCASTLAGAARPAVATSFVHFLRTPTAVHLMHRPGRGVAPGRFRPPVYVTLWS